MSGQPTEAELLGLVEAFYARVRSDPELGPLFEGHVEDWTEHLERLGAFWSSVMLGSGRYKGNPFAAHLKLRDRLEPALFARWLALWRATAAERFPPEIAAELDARAGRIAVSLQAGLLFRPEGAPSGPEPQRA
ncbi:group III truncated hemoglobin [Methylopila turkensis]|uniref:Preprotein translocase subunit TatC n=1 Tax=Methylopila turkensis TaxID=1437816 RepID=A0A9W6N618_9HYPH|nr:group III truncated hemoglobin [Methylopila turkensis]GLK78988.1 preprotein translocase subunit TatC [Methylopila turkensis]